MGQFIKRLREVCVKSYDLARQIVVEGFAIFFEETCLIGDH